MLARTADALFWIGRYVERAEVVARLLDVHLQLTLDPPPGVAEPWKPIVAISGDLLRFLERYDATNRETVIEFLVTDEGNPNSVVSCLRSARANARAVRELLSAPLWEHLNGTYLEVAAESFRARVRETPDRVFLGLRRAGRLCESLADDTLLHDDAWHVARLGRLLERAEKTLRILDLPHFLSGGTTETFEEVEGVTVLQSADALELYRRRHGRLRREGVVDFLLLERDFPRSVRSSLAGAEGSLHALTGTPEGGFRNPAEQRLGQLRAELAFARAEEIVADGLHDALDGYLLKLNLACDAVSEECFAAAALEIEEGS